MAPDEKFAFQPRQGYAQVMKLFTLFQHYFTIRRLTPALVLFAALLATAGQAPAQATAAVDATAGQAVAKISITNLSNQILAPIAVATHQKGAMPIFTPGAAASSELATLAETGNPVPLETLLRTDPAVLHATHLTGAATVIMPGETVSADIVFDFHHMSVSIASMLVSTNDAFVGYTGAQIPRSAGYTSYMAHAWDAGSEANTEACSDLPGPPCAEGSGNARVTDGAEGHVFIHPGIRAMADVPTQYDWRGPVARIKITGLGYSYR